MAVCCSNTMLWVAVCVLVLCPSVEVAKRDSKRDLLVSVTEQKEFKKLLRTRNNVLVVCMKNAQSASRSLDLYGDVAMQMKGLGTIAMVDCSDTQGKKLCKKMKASPNPLELKHYKDGEYNKDYDRMDTVKSMVNFMRDPTGDIPWDEDSTAGDVVHIDNKQGLTKLLKTEKRPILVMFYAPWCGFCKRLKPDYAAAATVLKGEHVLVGMDVDKPENMAVRSDYNITGFPTLYYFINGKIKYKYGGENNKDGLVAWMRDPSPPKEPAKEAEWADEESDVVHLTDGNFDEYLEVNPSVLVMFYAPWCGHCKNMKPEYTDAAATLKAEEIEGTLAAVDATKEKQLADRFKVKGFPSVKYFKDGQETFDFNERTADKLVQFMKDPQEPPPPPPPEPAWEDVPSDVIHLTEETFKPVLKKKKHTLVMFYAPWCGHCKKAKPEFMQAAALFQDDTKVAFAAMDCTQYASVCTAHDVSGYPTFKYFNYGKNAQKYTGGREENDFVHFMKDPLNPLASAPPPPPSPESLWSDVEGSENIHHLSEGNFDEFMSGKESVLVMFYAPWCGHCKAMKPAYGEAATKLAEENVKGVLATVDATAERELQNRFNVRGFPTLKYFKNGEEQFDYDGGRKTEDLVGFMKNPVKSEPPPPEPKWSDTPSSVNHLSKDSFSSFLAEQDHVLVMYYAPWCGHCKRAKPEYQDAAAELEDSQGRALAAVDCTSDSDLCKEEGVTGYPTFNYYAKGKFVEKYQGGRSKSDFVNFLKDLPSGKEEL